MALALLLMIAGAVRDEPEIVILALFYIGLGFAEERKDYDDYL